jgi:hypothetical protein
MGGWFLSRRDSPIVAWHEVPGRGALGVIYAPKVAKGLSLGFQTHLSFIHNLSVGSPPRPILLTPAFTHPLQSSFPPRKHRSTVRTEHRLGGLCYINAVASSLQVHGDSSRDGSGGSLDSPEGQWSIGFQPVVLFA